MADTQTKKINDLSFSTVIGDKEYIFEANRNAKRTVQTCISNFGKKNPNMDIPFDTVTEYVVYGLLKTNHADISLAEAKTVFETASNADHFGDKFQVLTNKYFNLCEVVGTRGSELDFLLGEEA